MKILFLIPMVLISNLVFSQKEYNFLISGTIGYRYTDDNSEIESSNFIQSQENLLQLNPAFGYFITKAIVAGIGFEYLYDKIKYDNYLYYNSMNKGFAVAPFARLYAPFGLFIHGEFDYGSSKLYLTGRAIPGPTGYISTSESYQYNKVIGFSVGIGYSIKVNEIIGIEPSIRYIGGKFNEKNPENDFTRKGLLMNIGMVCFIK